jgi:hypothetical protein
MNSGKKLRQHLTQLVREEKGRRHSATARAGLPEKKGGWKE